VFCLLDSPLFAAKPAIDVYAILYLRNCSLRLCLVAHKWNQILHFMGLWILGLNVTFCVLSLLKQLTVKGGVSIAKKWKLQLSAIKRNLSSHVYLFMLIFAVQLDLVYVWLL
jgi:hypothetical protein